MSAKTLEAIHDAIKAHLEQSEDYEEGEILIGWAIGYEMMDKTGDEYSVGYISAQGTSASATSGILHLASQHMDDAILGR